jgi:putative oxidoreductase
MEILGVFAFLDLKAEFLGSIGLILGLLTRIAAFGIACVMLVAVYRVHLQFGLLMNCAGTHKGEGIEYHLLVLAIAVVLMIKGGGALSVDRAISESAGASQAYAAPGAGISSRICERCGRIGVGE